MTKILCIPASKSLQLHFNFLLTFVSKSMVFATVLLLQYYYCLEDFEARNVQNLKQFHIYH